MRVEFQQRYYSGGRVTNGGSAMALPMSDKEKKEVEKKPKQKIGFAP